MKFFVTSLVLIGFTVTQPAFSDDHLGSSAEAGPKVCVANIQARKRSVQEILDTAGCKTGDKIVISTFLGKFGVPYLMAVAVTSGRVCDFTQSIVSNNVSTNTVTTCTYTGTVLPVIGSDKAMEWFSPK